MRLHFYGTGASEGVPAIFCKCKYCEIIRKRGGRDFRSRTSCQIDENLMIDFSADVFDHMRYGGLDMNQIDYLMITHAHSDHFYPEELLHAAPPFSLSPVPKTLTVVGNPTVCDKLTELGAEGISEYLKVVCIRNLQELSMGNFSVKALPADHDDTQECHLYILRKDGKTLLYAHDTGYFPEETWKALEGEYLDGVVLDCTCCNGPSYFKNHMGFEDDLRIQRRMMAEGMTDEKTVFVATHFVHTYGPIQDEMEKEFQKFRFIAAYDGMDVDI